MQIHYSDFIEHLLNVIYSDDIKFKKYIISIYSKNDIVSFTNYLSKYNSNEYSLLILLIKKYYTLFDCGDITKSDNLVETAINELHLTNFYKILFMENSIINAFKNYLKLNPIKLLIKFPYFFKGIEDSLTPYIQDFHSILFNHPSSKDDSMFFFNIIKNNDNHISVSINKLFLKTLLEYIADNSNTNEENNNLIIELNENIFTLSYGSMSIKAVFINSKDYINVFKIASFPHKIEKAMIIRSITDNLMPYEIGIAYLNHLNSYIEPMSEDILPSTLITFASISEVPYFKEIADMFSIPFAVFIHSIYPLDNLSEVLGVNDNFCGDNIIYSKLSLLSVLYKRRINSQY